MVVNDSSAADFTDFGYGNTVRKGFHQARAIPTGTDAPVEFLGSTTGPGLGPIDLFAHGGHMERASFMCMKVDMASLHVWAQSGNVFNETKSHGMRQLVTAPELLSPSE